MTVLVEISQDCSDFWAPSRGQFQTWGEAALAAATDDSQAVSISLKIVTAEEGKALNRQYRAKDYATNVLSFPVELPAGMPGMERRPLGDIVICPEVLEQEASEQNKAIEDHWAHIYTHGILHLLGFEHDNDESARIMEDIEVSTLQKFGIKNPYLIG